MSTPLFADTWYGTIPADQLRKEIQELYALLTALIARVEALEP